MRPSGIYAAFEFREETMRESPILSGIKGLRWPDTNQRIRAVMAESRFLLSKLSCGANKGALRDFV